MLKNSQVNGEVESEEDLLNRIIKKIKGSFKLESGQIADAVELYYDSQKLRLMHQNKQRSEAPDELVDWLKKWLRMGEAVIYAKLKQWVEGPNSTPEAQWAYSQIGIGPVIAAGLAAHIDVEKANSISAVWKFAGQAPGYDKKIKGKTLPYNARLKTLCWKLGESLVKVSGKEGATYGKLYGEFKSKEVANNAAGKNAAAAKRELETKKIRDKETKTVLEGGKLTDGHLHARAKRRAVKILLSHYWTLGREARGLAVREPYAIDIMGHTGKISPAEGTEEPQSSERVTSNEKSGREERAPSLKKSIGRERVTRAEQPKLDERARNRKQP
jgi:hypothetical protein